MQPPSTQQPPPPLPCALQPPASPRRTRQLLHAPPAHPAAAHSPSGCPAAAPTQFHAAPLHNPTVRRNATPRSAPAQPRAPPRCAPARPYTVPQRARGLCACVALHFPRCHPTLCPWVVPAAPQCDPCTRARPCAPPHYTPAQPHTLPPAVSCHSLNCSPTHLHTSLAVHRHSPMPHRYAAPHYTPCAVPHGAALRPHVAPTQCRLAVPLSVPVPLGCSALRPCAAPHRAPAQPGNTPPAPYVPGNYPCGH